MSNLLTVCLVSEQITSGMRRTVPRLADGQPQRLPERHVEAERPLWDLLAPGPTLVVIVAR